MTLRGWDVFALSELPLYRNLLILLIVFDVGDYCDDGTILSRSWESICLTAGQEKIYTDTLPNFYTVA